MVQLCINVFSSVSSVGSLSHVQLFVTPWTLAHQASLSSGFPEMLCCYVTSVMSNSTRPQRRQPTRLPHPRDSPGKNTGVGCHLLLQCMIVKSESEVAPSCPTPSNPMDCSPPGSSIHGIFQARVLEWFAIAFSAEMLYQHAK